ncbi:TPM domain-containing protein [Candidatus Woesearchaeota archaeon]|nr:TPM domain-containing protein [Candidatus Woesearchaeota archaeon]
MIKYLVLLLLFVSVVGAVDVPSRPFTLVNDLANVIDASGEAALEQRLQSLKSSGVAEIAILTIPTLENEAIESYSLKVVEAWKLGTEKQDNGLLILVAVDDRQYRFEVGYGLEGNLNDARVGRIGRDILVPAFQAGEYAVGLAQAVDVIAGILGNDPELIAAVDSAPQLPFGLLFVVTFIAGSIVSAIAWKQATKTRIGAVLGVGNLLILALVVWLIAYFFWFALLVLLIAAFPRKGGFMPFFLGGRGGGRIGGGGGFGGGGASGRW